MLNMEDVLIKRKYCHKEVAEVLKIPVETVHAHLVVAKKFIAWNV